MVDRHIQSEIGARLRQRYAEPDATGLSSELRTLLAELAASDEAEDDVRYNETDSRS